MIGATQDGMIPEISERQVMPPQASDKPEKTSFQDYLLAEYQYLAQAHFNTINTISEFFKQYILIVSLPISVAVVFLKPADLKTSGILDYLQSHPSIPSILLFLIFAVGLGVLGYVVNLRFDALLYARSVNGIRKSFYEASGLKIEDQLRLRVLPVSTRLPKYVEPFFFLFVVLTFAIVDTAYFYLGLYIYWGPLTGPRYVLWLFSPTRPITCGLMVTPPGTGRSDIENSPKPLVN
jgi:hypothetical protein